MIEFKQLDIKPEGNWFKRNFLTAHAKKTFIYTLIGAIGGLIYFYATDGKDMVDVTVGIVLKNMLIGGFIGFYLTNSPCARGRC